MSLIVRLKDASDTKLTVGAEVIPHVHNSLSKKSTPNRAVRPWFI